MSFWEFYFGGFLYGVRSFVGCFVIRVEIGEFFLFGDTLFIGW